MSKQFVIWDVDHHAYVMSFGKYTEDKEYAMAFDTLKAAEIWACEYIDSKSSWRLYELDNRLNR